MVDIKDQVFKYLDNHREIFNENKATQNSLLKEAIPDGSLNYIIKMKVEYVRKTLTSGIIPRNEINNINGVIVKINDVRLDQLIFNIKKLFSFHNAVKDAFCNTTNKFDNYMNISEQYFKHDKLERFEKYIDNIIDLIYGESNGVST